MFRRAALAINAINIAIILALFVSSGAQWFLLQSVAWTNMLISYSQDASFGEALEKTFDGQHPCSLCKEIQSADKQQKQKEMTQPTPVIKGVLVPVLTASAPSAVFSAYSSFESEASARFQQPSVPPPRLG